MSGARSQLLVAVLASLLVQGCTGIVGDLDPDLVVSSDAEDASAVDASDVATADTGGGDSDADTGGEVDARDVVDGLDAAGDGHEVRDTEVPDPDADTTMPPDTDPMDAPPLPGCGDGVVDAGEWCDGDCPQSCPAPSGCSAWRLEGSAQACTARCEAETISVCAAADGCCASGCNGTTDSDCAPQCGNGVVEGSERCDGNCPSAAACTSAGCTMRTWSGAAQTCDAQCVEAAITSCVGGDGCCAPGCTAANDGDCVLDCRDASSWPVDWAAAEDAALVELNAQRAAGTDCASGPKESAPPLTMDPALREAARCHSLDMATQNFFSHTGSDGSNFGQRASAAGYVGWPRYENIAAGNAGAVAAMGQWMASTKGHCDAVMDGSVTKVGLGYAYDANAQWRHYWTGVFGQ